MNETLKGTIENLLYPELRPYGRGDRDRLLKEASGRCAREENCDLLILPERPPSAVRRWLMKSVGLTIGSVSSVAVHSVQAPVVANK
jgi:hypothetical protein